MMTLTPFCKAFCLSIGQNARFFALLKRAFNSLDEIVFWRDLINAALSDRTAKQLWTNSEFQNFQLQPGPIRIQPEKKKTTCSRSFFFSVTNAFHATMPTYNLLFSYWWWWVMQSHKMSKCQLATESVKFQWLHFFCDYSQCYQVQPLLWLALRRCNSLSNAAR